MIYRHILLLSLTCIAILSPFLNKPVHVDDPVYIWVARQISQHPLDFYGFKINWGGHTEPLVDTMINPPLFSYYLAGAAKVTGWSEIALHTAVLPLSILSVIGVYFLAGHFCRFPFPAALMMALCPAFLISATTLMCDVPMACLWIWATVFWIRGSTGSVGWLPLAGFVAGSAVLTKYSGVCLIPLFIGYSILHPACRRTRIVASLALVIPVIMIVAYDHYTTILYGRGLFLDSVGFSSQFARQHGASGSSKILDALIFIGFGALVPAVVGLVAASGRSRWVLLGTIPLFVLAGKILFNPPGGWNSTWPFYLQAGVLAAMGASVAHACFSDRPDRNQVFLWLWVGGVFVFAAKLNWSINARSILPLIAPVCILTQRSIERRQIAKLRPYVLAAFAAVVITILAMIADYQSADVNRWAARQLMQNRSNEKVWFTGHWGFQYYMQQQGALALDEQSPACKPGDLVVVPLNNYGLPPKGVKMRAIDSLGIQGPTFLTLINGPMGADFYFSVGDRLPLVAGPIPTETFVVFRVVKNSAMP